MSSPVKRGYFRLDNASIDIRRCPDAAANCTAPACPESTSGCRGTLGLPQHLIEVGLEHAGSARRLQELNDSIRPSSSACYEDLMGVFCLLCAPRDDGVRVYYKAATAYHRARCEACGAMARDRILIALGIVLGVAAGALVVYSCYVLFVSAKRKQQLSTAWEAWRPYNKLKILVGFYMLSSRIANVYEVELPPTVERILTNAAIGISLGLQGAGQALQCLGFYGYVDTLTLYMVAPAVVAALILLGISCWLLLKSRFTADALLRASLPPLLQLMFLSYPLVTNAAFDAYHEYRFDTGSWLRYDVSIKIGTPEYDRALALAWVAISLYPIGLLVVSGALLFAARNAIRKHQPTVLSASISFLYR